VTAVDHWLAGLGRGGGVTIALIVALLLGLRHATDPDHLTAVSTLALSQERRGARRAGALGLAWGLGHATTLLVFGIPALLLRRFLPEPAQQAAELLIAFVIIALAVRLLVRWRRGYFHSHPHRHGGRWHTHPHVHELDHAAEGDHAGAGHHPAEHHHRHEDGLGRSPAAAYGIGLVHGMGGSAAVSVLLIGAIPDRLEATVALIVFALATAVSMSIVSAGFGALTVSRWLTDQLEAAVPMLGLFSLLFGVFYALSAVALA
jgi:ABC-type nickel/cobalt efflux system permease component RcnA